MEKRTKVDGTVLTSLKCTWMNVWLGISRWKRFEQVCLTLWGLHLTVSQSELGKPNQREDALGIFFLSTVYCCFKHKNKTQYQALQIFSKQCTDIILWLYSYPVLICLVTKPINDPLWLKLPSFALSHNPGLSRSITEVCLICALVNRSTIRQHSPLPQTIRYFIVF